MHQTFFTKCGALLRKLTNKFTLKNLISVDHMINDLHFKFYLIGFNFYTKTCD